MGKGICIGLYEWSVIGLEIDEEPGEGEQRKGDIGEGV